MEGLELVLIFIIWMMLLVHAWKSTALEGNRAHEEWAKSRAWEMGLAQSDALLFQHNENPWNGCAILDEAKKRTLSYVLDKKCLEKLSEKASPFVQEVAFESLFEKSIFFHRESTPTETCAGILRPTFLNEKNNFGILRVVVCHE